MNFFHQRSIHFKALELGNDTATPAGKFTLSTFTWLAEYSRERVKEKKKAGQQLAAAQGKAIGQPIGLNKQIVAEVRKALEKGLSMVDTVELMGISRSRVKRHCKHLQAAPEYGIAISCVDSTSFATV